MFLSDLGSFVGGKMEKESPDMQSEHMGMTVCLTSWYRSGPDVQLVVSWSDEKPVQPRRRRVESIVATNRCL